MRCKVGDLAIRIKSHPDSWIPVGAIVEIVRYHGITAATSATNRELPAVVRWNVKYQGNTENPVNGKTWALPDIDLMPIRDIDGVDETLIWKDVPTGENV